MIFLRSVEIKQGAPQNEYPFSLPVIRSLEKLEFKSPVTFLVGSNGSGKSTLLEALAVALKAVAIGSATMETDDSLQNARDLARYLKLVKNENPGRGFFFRAEDFFGFIKKVQTDIQAFKDLEEEFKQKHTGYGRLLSAGSARSQYLALQTRYGENPDGLSHGEAFLHLFKSRIVPRGLYILDEPETPLSPQLQLAFLSMLKQMVAESCQFIIATHSPLLMAFPDASILSIDGDEINEVHYDDVEQVSLTRSFLADPENYLRRL